MRALAATDAGAVRALLESSRSPYDALSRWAAESAIAGRHGEARALVAVDEHDAPIGIASYGPVGGADGTARLLGVAVSATARSREIAVELIERVVVELREAGMRLVVAEFPDTPNGPSLQALQVPLRDCDFRVAARVQDYFRDGVALVILRRDL